MSSDEFTDWQLFYEMQPFGPYRADLHAAIIARTVAQVNAPKGKNYQVKDFMPDFKPREKTPMSHDEIRAFLLAKNKGAA